MQTSLVGSYAQPDWLIDREKLRGRFPPRVRAQELWRVDPAYLEEAHDDATRLAIADQERAGLDIITDGEMRRESYSNRFATALEGVDIDNPGTALDRSGHPNPVPRVVGPVKRKHAVQVRDLQFLRAHTSRTVKMTVPGPFTMSQQAQNDHYEDVAELGMAYADAVREEILDLFAAGADIVQVDEPYMQARPEPARDRADHARDRIGMPAAVQRRAGVVDVDALERGREPVRVALAAHLAVGDDVQARALLVGDRQSRRVVLRLLEVGRIHPPQLECPHARREAITQAVAVEQPVRLRVGADQARRNHGASLP